MSKKPNPVTRPLVEAMTQVTTGHEGLVTAEAVMQAALVILDRCAWPDHLPELLRNCGDYLHRVADQRENHQAQHPMVLQ
ncbi:hypothetical protein [Falsiroseomonas sp.]|uniref:hypothetical protein n=1 Tax=Falsiroseomonas sp. TaxID=2870721 RepID=UPI003F70694C